jgi:hypothetical protein
MMRQNYLAEALLLGGLAYGLSAQTLWADPPADPAAGVAGDATGSIATPLASGSAPVTFLGGARQQSQFQSLFGQSPDGRQLTAQEQYWHSLDPETRSTMTGGWGLQNLSGGHNLHPIVGSNYVDTSGGQSIGPEQFSGARFNSWSNLQPQQAASWNRGGYWSQSQQGGYFMTPATTSLEFGRASGISYPSSQLSASGGWNLSY